MIKKIIGINVLLLVLIGLIACSKKNEEVKTTEVTEKETSNSYFTEEYFEGVKSISSFTSDEVITDKKIISEISKEFINISLKETDKKILDYAGTSILKLVYENGTEKNISYTSELILINDKTYGLEKDIATKIASYF